MKQALTNQELFHFCEQFSILLPSGISAAEGLQILCDDSKDPQSKTFFEALLHAQEETGSFSQALSDSGFFPASMTAYVKAGEETGCLDEVMKILAEHYSQEIEITSGIRNAVAYPLLMLGMMGAVIIILLVKVLPVFQQVFRQMGLEMNGLSSGLLSIGSVISRYSAVLLSILLILILAAVFLGCTSRGRELLGNLVSHLPIVRQVPSAIDYGRFTQAVSMGLRSGIDPDESLNLARQLVSRPEILERIDKAQALLADGALFADALKESGLFQGMDARLISVGYQSGSMDDVMNRLSGKYQKEAREIIQQTVSIVEPTIVILLSIVVGLVLLSVMMPLLGILSDMMM